MPTNLRLKIAQKTALRNKDGSKSSCTPSKGDLGRPSGTNQSRGEAAEEEEEEKERERNRETQRGTRREIWTRRWKNTETERHNMTMTMCKMAKLK